MPHIYLKYCPRGFANEVVYLRVNADDQAARAQAEQVIDRLLGETTAYAEWSTDKIAEAPGVAVEWEDRNHVLPDVLL